MSFGYYEEALINSTSNLVNPKTRLGSATLEAVSYGSIVNNANSWIARYSDGSWRMLIF